MSPRVLIVSNMYPSNKYPSYGIFVKRFCEELKRININFELSCMKKSRFKILKILNYFNFYLITFFKIILKKYDIIYIHYASHSCIPALFASKFKKLRIYTNVHGSDVVPENKKQLKFQKYTQKVLSISEKIIVPSIYFKRYVSNKYGIEEDKINIYPSSGIDIEKFYPYPASKIKELKRKYNIEEDKTIFLYAGRITEGKGWDILLNSINLIDSKNCVFIIAGDGNQLVEFSALCSKLKLNDRIIKLPLLSEKELINYYNLSDAFIFPTRREGESLGLVALESMACGTPVISSDFAAPSYYVKNGVNGYKFEVNNSHMLASIMKKFIESEYSKKQISKKCRDSIKCYSSSLIREELKKIFE